MVKLTYDLKGLKELDDIFDIAVDKAIHHLQPILQEYVRSHHKYKNDTGYLTSRSFVKDIKASLHIFNDAEYAQHVAKPHGSWSGDDWIEDTIYNNMDLIKETIQRFIIEESRRR